MKKIIVANGRTFGAFDSVTVLPNRLEADDKVYLFSVIGESYEIQDVADDWTHPPPPPKQPTQEEIIKQYEAALDKFLDDTAKSLTFKDRHALALRAAYPNPWQQLGLAFGTWMDGINAQSWQLLSDVLAGVKPMPTVEEYIAGFPAFEVPQ